MREGRKRGPRIGGALTVVPREPGGGWVWVGDHIVEMSIQ